MSVLVYPRIHFNGKCLINPATGNNDDVVVNMDRVNIRILPELAALSDAQARAWLIQGIRAISPINENVHTYLRCGWKYYGDMCVRFQAARVSAVVGTEGHRIRHDPILDGAIRLLGSDRTAPVICAVDSTGVSAAQIFAGGLSLGDPSLGLSATYDTRAYNRWIVWRNAQIYQGEQNFVGAGATWQFGIPCQAVTFYPGASRVLAELQEAVRKAQGILVQFCFFLSQPQ